MKLKSFQIKNYKSIVDSGVCRLSEVDNILILAGQNESGKSSVLQAVYDFERDELREDALIFSDETIYPEITCTFTEDDSSGDIGSYISDQLEYEGEEREKLVKAFKEVKDFTLVRKFNVDGSTLTINPEIGQIFEATLTPPPTKINATASTDETSGIEEAEKVALREQAIKDIAENKEGIAKALSLYTPRVIFFDDLGDLLPSRIYLSELKSEKPTSKGFNAVKNLEKILGVDFLHFEKYADSVSETKEEAMTRSITANFNERWTQKIHEDNIVKIKIAYKQGGVDAKGPYINFYVLTKEDQHLTPEQRSNGLRWFLSFYLELTAQSERGTDLIILFDEPGLFLHANAQKDIKRVMQELAEKGDQILYSTHSPYLIDSDRLGRVRLIINTKDSGTVIEKITTKRVKDQKDALRPIIDAMGLDIAHGFTPLCNENVLLEGMSDHYYFNAFKTLLGNDRGYQFIPAMGAPNIHLLMELCVGWGLNWVMILDDDRASKTAFNAIRKSFFDDKEDDAKEKIYRIPDTQAIEEIFEVSDLILVEPSISKTTSKTCLELIEEHGGKVLFAHKFNEKVKNKEIKTKDVSKKALGIMTSCFEFINSKLPAPGVETDKATL